MNHIRATLLDLPLNYIEVNNLINHIKSHKQSLNTEEIRILQEYHEVN